MKKSLILLAVLVIVLTTLTTTDCHAIGEIGLITNPVPPKNTSTTLIFYPSEGNFDGCLNMDWCNVLCLAAFEEPREVECLDYCICRKL